MLEEMKGKIKGEKLVGRQKQVFYGELLKYARRKGYNRGWAMHKYRERMGEFPNGIDPIHPERGQQMSKDTANWITHTNIKAARGKRGRPTFKPS